MNNALQGTYPVFLGCWLPGLLVLLGEKVKADGGLVLRSIGNDTPNDTTIQWHRQPAVFQGYSLLSLPTPVVRQHRVLCGRLRLCLEWDSLRRPPGHVLLNVFYYVQYTVGRLTSHIGLTFPTLTGCGFPFDKQESPQAVFAHSLATRDPSVYRISS